VGRQQVNAKRAAGAVCRHRGGQGRNHRRGHADPAVAHLSGEHSPTVRRRLEGYAWAGQVAGNNSNPHRPTSASSASSASAQGVVTGLWFLRRHHHHHHDGDDGAEDHWNGDGTGHRQGDHVGDWRKYAPRDRVAVAASAWLTKSEGEIFDFILALYPQYSVVWFIGPKKLYLIFQTHPYYKK
jgi:hypothetical protein